MLDLGDGGAEMSVIGVRLELYRLLSRIGGECSIKVDDNPSHH